MPSILPFELLAEQFEALDLAQSMFALPGELILADRSEAFLSSLRAWIEAGDISSDNLAQDDHWTDSLDFQLHLNLDNPTISSSTTFPLSLSARIPLVESLPGADTTASGAPRATVRLQQPPWLSRTAHDALSSSLLSLTPTTFSSNAELILETVDYAREEATKLLPDETEAEASSQTGQGRRRGRGGGKPGQKEKHEPEFRAWMYLMSLSTREKRDDMVDWAPEYGLTGFVLAGKPGLLCVEGAESNIQAYLADIKSNSWADIPSFQKKITERHRTPLLPSTSSSAPITPSSRGNEDPTSQRVFTDFCEITSLINHGGHRGQRVEMGEVKAFLEAKGFGDILGLVIGGGQFS
ncbi:hypothetical protein JCM11641_007658 [Rhodosporidiobolus odoratus]